ncbi:uncharacterized protein LOC119631535 isoform X1 [Glossina fuscipes]|uniref:Uncharacterized protein LOC119631535 isoform X1 n=2 Tax=Nemorhina TaxID=44051 RepID=A0A8U0W3N9_9MUSC|nr:uncharacterized protein LOC119631535 isoform X1 [Glossina fuscipes]KAI9588514.1 hypothetical protein GQX74_004359 [Glossina fuscipes]
MIKFLLTFGVGLYTGIYVSQNYEIPRVDEPSRIVEKLKDLIEEHRKNRNAAEQLLHDVKKEAKKIID